MEMLIKFFSKFDLNYMSLLCVLKIILLHEQINQQI